jgi:hypothetical protein
MRIINNSCEKEELTFLTLGPEKTHDRSDQPGLSFNPHNHLHEVKELV